MFSTIMKSQYPQQLHANIDNSNKNNNNNNLNIIYNNNTMWHNHSTHQETSRLEKARNEESTSSAETLPRMHSSLHGSYHSFWESPQHSM
jgi:hypothetical protein